MDKFLDTLYLYLTKLFLSKGSHKTVTISGSVGKTSTTQAIATVLTQKFNVLTTKHNYNTHRGVAMTVFDLTIPESRFGWLGLTFTALRKAFFTKPKFEIAVLEIGTDVPGDLEKFKFLAPDIAVITAVTSEHMEYFKTIEAVATEELTLTSVAKESLINAELVDARFVRTDSSVTFFGDGTQYTATEKDGLVVLKLADAQIQSHDFNLVGKSGVTTLLASAVVATKLGLGRDEILEGLKKVNPVAGRMSRLKGVNGSTIIDDTYNSSPEAVRSALDYLYSQKSAKKIALLGMMNEMGEQSEALHREVGTWCDSKQIDLLVTLGEHANIYLADEAEKNGCKVIRTKSPYEAGEIIKAELTNGTVVLAKGSQNGVFAEEAVKQWLADPNDVSRLVRQHSYWPAKKAKQFM